MMKYLIRYLFLAMRMYAVEDEGGGSGGADDEGGEEVGQDPGGSEGAKLETYRDWETKIGRAHV